jgi:hypothetical protein
MGVWEARMNFITKTKFNCDLEKIKADLESLLKVYAWPEMDKEKLLPGNQIGLTHRSNATDIWLDASGSLYDKTLKKFTAEEKDFNTWNPHTPSYTRTILENLAEQENTSFGRIRFMRLMPKSGLSVHPDFEHRYHLSIVTNKYSYFGEHVGETDVSAKCYHIPSDGYFYKVDTTREHFVYNGGWEPRIHLVLCEAK